MQSELKEKEEEKGISQESSAQTKKDEESEMETLEDLGRPRKRRRKHVVRDIVLLGAVVFLVAVGYAALSWKNTERDGAGKIREKTLTFVKENMVSPGTEVKISEFVREGSLYRVVLMVGKETITAYASADGKNFFPQVVDMDAAASKEKAPPPVVEAATKKEKPDVDLFVMSYCPYGLQAQKGVLPVIEALGSSINFSMRFVNYTMHGKKEFNENIRQYCIAKETPTMYSAYLSCFTTSPSGDSVGCGKTAKLNEAKIATCVAATDTKFKLSEKYDSANEGNSPFGIDQALNEKYGVQGSPTLVVNGETLSAGRDPKSLLKAICSGFTTAPEACSAELSSDQPTPGFGSGVASANSSANASCN